MFPLYLGELPFKSIISRVLSLNLFGPTSKRSPGPTNLKLPTGLPGLGSSGPLTGPLDRVDNPKPGKFDELDLSLISMAKNTPIQVQNHINDLKIHLRDFL